MDYFEIHLELQHYWLGTAAHACNPSTLGGEVSRSQGQEIKTILANMVKPHLYQKLQKLAGCGGVNL